ncbi:uncharacterized protein ACA1_106790 [Acanthamoeba castellanii str. Neff]|uniref:Uncharacterized protein n=1 Tax=Acanthamoeba castellanii (strain ATCC 30010 / Neff) TaxID=1257118 RepID=L8GNI0_ACACF|nr:uncharacterized protein ACA1_106790 [Acanthamoeba castellanii str. Neff]ELR14308.1 hypothetical protein ACA1_106790 [Acanthamoeba castellanii str. Neff]
MDNSRNNRRALDIGRSSDCRPTSAGATSAPRAPEWRIGTGAVRFAMGGVPQPSDPALGALPRAGWLAGSQKVVLMDGVMMTNLVLLRPSGPRVG